MTSKIKVNILADGGDNAIITSDGSGSVTINNASLKSTPAFAVTTQNVGLTADTFIKLTFETEILDTDNAYDNSTNYRFTVPSGKAGTYLIQVRAATYASNNLMKGTRPAIYKNGSLFASSYGMYFDSTNSLRHGYAEITVLIPLVAGDYIEGYVYPANAGTSISSGGGTGVNDYGTMMWGYRLIGA